MTDYKQLMSKAPKKPMIYVQRDLVGRVVGFSKELKLGPSWTLESLEGHIEPLKRHVRDKAAERAKGENDDDESDKKTEG